MEKNLIKQGKKYIEAISLQVKGKLLYVQNGKVGQFQDQSIRNCGSEEKAIATLYSLAEGYKEKGFIETEKRILSEPEIFDKAKWHLNEEFPKGLNDYQAYVHTGFYIGWILNNNLVNDDFQTENKEEIETFKKKAETGVRFYMDILDGVFSSEYLTEEGASFTKKYFDFDNGKYIGDYHLALAKNLPSIFHVQDNKENFQKISSVIQERYERWRL